MCELAKFSLWRGNVKQAFALLFVPDRTFEKRFSSLR